VVVVAELDLVDGDSVVFVDDGNDVPLHEGGQGVLDVDEALAVRQVVHREQDLGDVEVMPAEGIGVDAHDPALPDGGAGLLFGHALELPGDPHAVLPRRDGPGGDDDDVVAPPDEFRHLVDELLNDVPVEALRARENAASDLDDDPPYAFQDFLALSAHSPAVPVHSASIF